MEVLFDPSVDPALRMIAHTLLAASAIGIVGICFMALMAAIRGDTHLW